MNLLVGLHKIKVVWVAILYDEICILRDSYFGCVLLWVSSTNIMYGFLISCVGDKEIY